MVKVGCRGSGRVSVAGLIGVRPGRAPRLIYRMRVYHGRRGEAKGFTEKDYARLLDAAHAQWGGPIVLVWDNLGSHVSAAMNARIAARPWLTVFQLPTYAPELNPVEGVWAHLKKSLINFAKRTVAQLVELVKNRLKRMQYRPVLLQGFLAKSGIDLQPP